jgi:hypothetical protein
MLPHYETVSDTLEHTAACMRDSLLSYACCMQPSLHPSVLVVLSIQKPNNKFHMEKVFKLTKSNAHPQRSWQWHDSAKPLNIC